MGNGNVSGTIAVHDELARTVQESVDSALANALASIRGRYDRGPNGDAEEIKYYGHAFDNVANELAKLSTGYSDASILGLREQIKDNVKTLGPYLKASSKFSSTSANGAIFAHGSRLNIVTIGQEPKVRACVFSFDTTTPKKLIHSEEASDATGALSSLLKKTQSMLASQFGYSTTASSKRAKVASGVTSFTSSSSIKFQGPKIAGRVAPICDALVSSFVNSKASIAKANEESEAKHARTKSNTGLWDSSKVNNNSFHESCGEHTGGGGDSGFLSRDGEAHPNRSYNDLLALNNAPPAHAVILAETSGSVVGEEVSAAWTNDPIPMVYAHIAPRVGAQAPGVLAESSMCF